MSLREWCIRPSPQSIDHRSWSSAHSSVFFVVVWMDSGGCWEAPCSFIGQPLSGRLADAIGARRLGIIAVSGFGQCSAAAMFAPTFTVLVAIRAGQADVASGLSPSVQSLLRSITAPSERGRAFGLQGSVIGVGAGLGPVIGGLLLAGFGWRAIFAVNIPIVIIALIVLQRSVPVDANSTDAHSRDAHSTGAIIETGAPTNGHAPRLFNRVFSAAFATQALSVFAQYTLLLVTPIVLDDRGWGTGSIGIALSTLTLGMIVMGPPGGRLGDEWGRRRACLLPGSKRHQRLGWDWPPAYSHRVATSAASSPASC